MADNKHKLFVALLFTCTAALASCGKPQDRGVIVGSAIPAEVVADKLTRQQNSTPVATRKSIRECNRIAGDPKIDGKVSES